MSRLPTAPDAEPNPQAVASLGAALRWNWRDLAWLTALLLFAILANDWLLRSYPALNDLYYHMSLYKFTYSALLGGEIPHWNEYSSCGIPNLAVPINHAFAPTLVLAYAIDDVNYIHQHSMAWLCIGVAATYALGRRYGRCRVGGAVATVLYVTSGAFQFYTEGGNSHDFFVGMCMLPLLLLCFEWFESSRRRRAFTVCCLLMGLHLLTSHLQAAYYNLLVLGAWSSVRIVALRPQTVEGRRQALPLALTFLLVVVSGLMMAAPDWGPKALYGSEGVELVRSQGVLGSYTKYMSLVSERRKSLS